MRMNAITGWCSLGAGRQKKPSSFPRPKSRGRLPPDDHLHESSKSDPLDYLFRSGGSQGTGLGLLCDDVSLDFVVGGLRNDFLVHQVQFCAVRTAVDNFLRVDIADAGQNLELIFGGGVEIELIAGGGGTGGHPLSGGWRNDGGLQEQQRKHRY